jgi:hypothetical protein
MLACPSAEQAEDDVVQGGENLGTIARPRLMEIFTECDVPDPMPRSLRSREGPGQERDDLVGVPAVVA